MSLPCVDRVVLVVVVVVVVVYECVWGKKGGGWAVERGRGMAIFNKLLSVIVNPYPDSEFGIKLNFGAFSE